jgi:hypothetical protein
MKKSEYRRLYDALNKQEDIARLAKKTGLNEELLLVLYTQKTVRKATKHFYKVKHRVPVLLKKWNSGRSFLSLSRELAFPPILTAYLILQENKVSRKRFWEFVRDPATVKDNRLRKEIAEAVKHDMVYSPEGNDLQYERGKMGEKRLCDWLDRQNLEYETEDELKGNYQKTPDALLKKTIRTNGMNVKWIESKASFGDEIEIRKNTKRQLKAYTELFGQGIVVYWFGFIEGTHPPKNVLIVDETFFEKDLKSR